MIKEGFRWFVKTPCGEYEFEEYTYPTFDAVKEGMRNCLADSVIPFSACGIDLVEDDDGSITFIERLVEPTETYYDENKKPVNEITNIQPKNSHLTENVDDLDEEVEILGEECIRLSDALEENEGQVIHYIAVSLDLELCVPLVSENPLQAGQELINKCLAKGVPYGGFKVFEKSELL